MVAKFQKFQDNSYSSLDALEHLWKDAAEISLEELDINDPV